MAKTKVRLNTNGITFLVLGFFSILIITVGLVAIARLLFSGQETSESIQTEISVTPTNTPTPTPAYNFFEGMNSNSAILIDVENGEILQEINADLRSYPASVTKMMTVLVALDYMENLDMTYTMPIDIYNTLATTYNYDLATAGFENTETVRYIDLLYGVMLRSGAECCLACADICAGSEEAFVELMNAKAAELGLVNTHFTNCTGYDNPDHYSTPRDMAVVLSEGLRNETFRMLITTSVYLVPPTNYHSNGLELYNTLSYAMVPNSDDAYTILGGKTGYTSEAGQCLASFADVRGREYLLVTFGARVSEEEQSTLRLHVSDAQLIYSRLSAYIDRTT